MLAKASNAQTERDLRKYYSNRVAIGTWLSLAGVTDGFCQTDQNWLFGGEGRRPLCRTESTPLGESSGAVGFEIESRVEMTLLVKMIADRGVKGDEFL